MVLCWKSPFPMGGSSLSAILDRSYQFQPHLSLAKSHSDTWAQFCSLVNFSLKLVLKLFLCSPPRIDEAYFWSSEWSCSRDGRRWRNTTVALYIPLVPTMVIIHLSFRGISSVLVWLLIATPLILKIVLAYITNYKITLPLPLLCPNHLLSEWEGGMGRQTSPWCDL